MEPRGCVMHRCLICLPARDATFYGGPPHSSPRHPRTRPQFAEPSGDRGGRNPRGPRHQGRAAPAEGTRLGRRPYAARSLRQRRRQRPVFRSTTPEVHSLKSILRSFRFHHLLSYDTLVRPNFGWPVDRIFTAILMPTWPCSRSKRLPRPGRPRKPAEPRKKIRGARGSAAHGRAPVPRPTPVLRQNLGRQACG